MRSVVRAAGYGVWVLSALASLGACGSRTALQRTPDMTPVPVAQGAEQPETSDQLMEPDIQARPDRSAEPLRRSQERQEDPFDLPPS